jgi:SAM-dependent methyltransferase
MKAYQTKSATVSKHHDFLNPLCLPSTLDSFISRRAILKALRSCLNDFNGIVLDVGCGYMPYKGLVLSPPSRATEYLGLDLENGIYRNKPDIYWKGNEIPLAESSVDCAMATEVLEHTPNPESVLREIQRVLTPGGLLFFTVPFLWPLHDVPFDEYRYTPYALSRHLRNSGFEQVNLRALGGWDASIAQVIGLWIRRRPMSAWKRAILSYLTLPIVRYLAGRDRPPAEFREGTMITGISGTALKRFGFSRQ